MSLNRGHRLGPYEIVSLVGAGGMGEVYRARDMKLDRDVALKVLPESFASDPDRLMRFEREAKTLAGLNHPNIAQAFGIEEASGSEGLGFSRAIAMELVDGEDLSTRIVRGPIPIDEALPIARQIAEALEAAHEDAKARVRDIGDARQDGRRAAVAPSGVGALSLHHEGSRRSKNSTKSDWRCFYLGFNSACHDSNRFIVAGLGSGVRSKK